MPNIKYETTIPFQGFYGSIHENEVEWTIEQEIQNLQDEYKKTDNSGTTKSYKTPFSKQK